MTGYTMSTDLPATAGAYDESYNGGLDAFLVQMNSTGTSSSYVTYLGTAGSEEGEGVAMDGVNGVYLAGTTNSDVFPTTGGVYDDTHNGSDDVFIIKFDASMNPFSLVYSTYFGGNGIDRF